MQRGLDFLSWTSILAKGDTAKRHRVLSPLPPTPQVVDELVRRNSREDYQDWGVAAQSFLAIPPHTFYHGSALHVVDCVCVCLVGQVLKLTGPVLVQDMLHANG